LAAAVYSPLREGWTVGVADIVDTNQGDRGAALQGGQFGRAPSSRPSPMRWMAANSLKTPRL
jgi:hypothetical protein